MDEEADRFGLKPTRILGRIQQSQIEEADSSDFLLSPSRLVRDSFVEQGYEPERTAVVPYGVDLQRFHPLPEESELDGMF